MTNILNVKNLEKTYQSGEKELKVLDDISFSIQTGDTFAIVGPSGSGKTTLLGLCAGLDQANQGEIELCGTKINSLNEDDLKEFTQFAKDSGTLEVEIRSRYTDHVRLRLNWLKEFSPAALKCIEYNEKNNK